MKKNIKLLFFIFFIVVLYLIFTRIQNNKVKVYEYNKEYTILEEVDDFFKIKSQNKYGIINKNGKLVVTPVFDKLFLRKDSPYIIVQQNGKYGVVTKDNNIILNYVYTSLISLNSTSVLGKKDNEIILIDLKENKKVIYPDNYIIKYINNNYYVIKKNQIEVLNEEFKLVSTYDGKDIHRLSDRILLLENKNDLFLIKDNAFYKFIENIEQIYKEYFVVDNNGKKELRNIDNKVLIKEFDSIYISDLENIIVEKDKKYGVIDINNSTIIPLEYDKITPMFQGYYGVEKKFEKLEMISNKKYATTSRYNSGLLDSAGKEVIEIKYEGILNFNQYFAIVIDHGKLKVLSLINGRSILETDDGEVEILGNDKFILKKNGVIKVYNEIGRLILNVNKDLVRLISSKYIITNSKIYEI